MVISRVIIRVAPFRALITYLLSPLPLQVGAKAWGTALRAAEPRVDVEVSENRV